MSDISKWSVKKLAIESEDNKLLQGTIWTKAYALEAKNKKLQKRIAELERQYIFTDKIAGKQI